MTDVSKKEKYERAKDYICLALDLNDEHEILRCVDELVDLVGSFKLNSAFTLFGPALVRQILERGCKVFLDLKLHDIPHTVGGYADAVTRMGVHMVTLHTAGGLEMMRTAMRAADKTAQELGVARPKIIGVTVLTSIDQKTLNEELNITGSVAQEVSSRTRLAVAAGLDGIVCSAADLASIRGGQPKGFLYVTPGVRPIGADHHDQVRVETYRGAIIDAGSSLLVIGRGILGAKDKREAASQVLEEVASGL